MVKPEKNPLEPLIRQDALPSVWCPGCGIGIVVNTFLQSIRQARLDADNITLISSGISCTGKVADFLNLKNQTAGQTDVFRTALEYKSQHPNRLVVLFVNDNDLIASGVAGFQELCGSELPVLVLFINSFIYHMLVEHRQMNCMSLLNPAGKDEAPSLFNLPHLADSSGAGYIARWTPLHCRRLSFSIKDAVKRDTPAVIEVISPCLMYFASEEGPGITLDRMNLYLRNSIIKHDEPTQNLNTRDMQNIVLGKFIDR